VISAIVLAAGLARRFGSPKTLVSYHGKPLVRHVLDALAIDAVAQTIVVIPASPPEHAMALAESAAVVVVNHDANGGMSDSLRLGLGAVDPRAQAVVIALGDQPTIDRAVVRAIVQEWRATRAAVVAPLYRGERGHPVLFDATVFEELRQITGDRGAREVIARDPSRVRFITVDGDAPPDIDTPHDLAKLTL